MKNKTKIMLFTWSNFSYNFHVTHLGGLTGMKDLARKMDIKKAFSFF